MRRFSLTTLAIVVLVIVGCSFGKGESNTASGSEAGASHKEKGQLSQKEQLELQGTFELPNGRSLDLSCYGSGSPTIVLEVGQDYTPKPPYDMSTLQSLLAERHLTCRYARANTGTSGTAPKPRSAGDIVTDLHELLETADVPGPYVLAGNSAGGTFVQLYGRRYPDEVAGVVAMNPVPPAYMWLHRALPLLTKEERAQELSFYRGEQGYEHIDWLASSPQLKKAPPPPPVPFEMLISTKKQCEGDSFCEKTYKVYEEVLREVAHQWPEGSFHQVDSLHDIYVEKPETVVDTVNRVASK